MNKKLITFGLIGILLIAGIAIAQITGTPPTIPNGFTLTMPNLPSNTGQNFGACGYNPSGMHPDNIKVWYNDAISVGQAQVHYTFEIKHPTCAKGFVGNITYSTLSVISANQLINTMQQDFENQILNSIALPDPKLSPIATGNSVGGAS